MDEIGREIRRLREEKGWSQAKLAVDAGIGVSAVSLIETGKRNPSATTLAKIAEALGVGVADLFPLAQAPLLDPSNEEPSGTAYMKMSAAEFDAVRESAIAGELDGAALRQMLLHEYNAAERDYKSLKEAGAPEEDLEEAKQEYLEAKKRWTVALFDDAERTIALDKKRDASIVERTDVRTLPLDEAYDQIRGVVQALAGAR
jgi:transcriptional regulator with XRE-family HTH domain